MLSITRDKFRTVIMSDIEKQDAELKQKCREKLRNVTDVMEKLRLSILSRGSGSIKGIGRLVSHTPVFAILPPSLGYIFSLPFNCFAEYFV